MNSSYIISLQGGMAAGKTTLAKRLESSIDDVVVSYENTLKINKKVCESGINRNRLDDFIEIQRMFIKYEVERYENLRKYDKVIIDLGADDIEFYTLNYPLIFNKNWDIEKLLKNELKELRKCVIDGMLFLQANKETLKKHKDNDRTRNRNSFDFYIENFHKNKINWFLKKKNLSVLDIDSMNSNEVFKYAINWIKQF